MDEERLRMTMKMIEEAKAQFPETAEFINERLEQECSKEIISVEQLWGGSEKTTKHRRNKKRPDESLTTSNTVETEGLNEQAEKVEKPEDAADVIKQYEEIIRTKMRVLYL